MVDARGLHAVATRAVATKNSRKVDGKEYPFFYNPMWRYFGDENDRPSGTYYYGGSEPKTYFWNIYDQVLLRPNLVPLFEQQELRILTGDGKQEFLKKGVPDKAISDHLPILFKLNI
ncbi:MAG: hypothetical protein IAF08_04025 [Rhizobacter sp.]|nr:hypothetical protein [Chlorobiales bacterium]